MTDNTLTLTQDELDDMIAKRIARVHKEYEGQGRDNWKARSRQWEDRCKENAEDRDRWKSRARFNLAQIQILERLNEKLITRFEGRNS